MKLAEDKRGAYQEYIRFGKKSSELSLVEEAKGRANKQFFRFRRGGSEHVSEAEERKRAGNRKYVRFGQRLSDEIE